MSMHEVRQPAHPVEPDRLPWLRYMFGKNIRARKMTLRGHLTRSGQREALSTRGVSFEPYSCLFASAVGRSGLIKGANVRLDVVVDLTETLDGLGQGAACYRVVLQ